MLLEGDYIEDETKIKMVINEAAVTFMCRQDGERMACKIVLLKTKYS